MHFGEDLDDFAFNTISKYILLVSNPFPNESPWGIAENGRIFTKFDQGMTAKRLHDGRTGLSLKVLFGHQSPILVS